MENANVGITIANDMMAYSISNPIQLSASFPFGCQGFAINPPSVVQLDFAVFTNNYFDIYALAETGGNSFIKNCEFYTNSNKMLPPYEPKNGQLTATEAAIVLYKCKPKGSFYSLIGSEINISDCIFSTGIITDILVPTGHMFSGNNEFYYPMLCAVRYYIPKYGAEAAISYVVENQKIYIKPLDDNTISSYKHQLDNLDSYWNTINGFYNDVNYTCILGHPFVYSDNPNIARHGLSTGYPKIWNTNFTPREGWIGIFTPYEVFTGNTDNSNVRLTCKNVEFVGGDNFNIVSRNFGIYAGALATAENNKFRFLDNGITTEQASYVACIGNYFEKCNNGIVFKAFNNSITGTAYNYNISCNDFSKANVYSPPPTPMGVMPDNNTEVPENLNSNGIVFENGCTNSNINGGIDANDDDIPLANIFPVRDGVNRSSTQDSTGSNEITSGWTSPIGWRSIVNLNPNSIVKHTTFKNCFVGNCLPNANEYPLIRVYEPLKKCYTQGNIDALGYGYDFALHNYTLVCENSYDSNQIVFPNIGRKGFSTDSAIIPVTLSPNPATENLTIRGLKNQGYSEVHIIDRTGKTVYSYQIPNLEFVSIPVEKLSIGVYSLKLLGFNKTHTFKFVKQ